MKAQNPLYDPRFEHDACGVGFVARIDGTRSHEIVEQGLEALLRMQHRGATGADPDTGDGAGLMLQLPDRYFRRWAREELGLTLPPAGDYAIAQAFLPREPALRLRCEELMVRISVEEGQRPLGWRTVPVRPDAIGTLARQSEPAIRQLVIGRGRDVTPGAFKRKLTVIRRRVELAAAARRIPEESFCIPSISNATLTYKGLLMASQLAAYYPDLEEPEFESAIALVHSRFSTNTLGTWDLAQPFNLLAHNGEINTVRGNRSWMNAREPLLRSALLGDDLQKLFPIIEDRWSDSAALDAALELLTVAGRAPAHALSMLVPAAWTGDEEMPDEVKAFYEYHATIVEPWDGPAALAFCDGRYVGALLDRNGLRPARYQVTRDGLVVMASEVGVLDLDPADVVVSDRVAPGRMLLVDTVAGRIVPDAELKQELAARRPYRHLLNRQKLYLEDLPPAPGGDPGQGQPLALLQKAFGYTQEDLDLLVTPMAVEGQEPVSSMGVDTPLAVLSERPQLLPAFFKQHFAQVTNPAIDPQREGLVMSLRTVLGSQANLLDEVPDSERRVILSRPILLPGDLEKLYALPSDQFKVGRISCLYDPAGGGEALDRALDTMCRDASRLVRRGHGVIVLSDRGVDEQRAPIPMLLATAAVHSHLVREGGRSRTSVVVESGEPREVMHYALLVGFGAAAIMPYLAFDTVASLHATGDAGGGTVEQAVERYVKAVSKGILKVLAKMGISTVQSYRGAAIFEAVGLGNEVAARFFPGTPSRVGGVGLAEIAADAATRHGAAFGGEGIDAGGLYRFRIGGEAHVWDPPTIVALQRSVRDGSRNGFRAYCEAVDGASAAAGTLRSLLTVKAAGEPVPLDEVEPVSEIVKRFASGAMSLGALSQEAHETLAIAMNRIGGRSNSGEGGEDLHRSTPDPNGDLRRSAIKQVASARFGVTTGYLADADQLQIKVSQGAKPGEGGQLPGHKVDATIARLRHATPGVGLISPPPHHDIYSIEDLAQLIHDLRCVNPSAEISVKLVAEAGVGTVAAGVAKARADHIVIAGHDGGTGASPASSTQHAGLPWELGLAETQQVLVQNGLRGRVRVQADGGMRTPRDVLVAALLGAEEFAFSTAPLIAAGCVMMRVCHLNTCPVGIASQDPELRRRFTGTPEHVVRFFWYLAEELREQLAELGARSLDELVGRCDLLEPAATVPGTRAALLDLRSVVTRASGPEGTAHRQVESQDRSLGAELDVDLLASAGAALEKGTPVTLERQVRNVHRSLGALFSGELVRRHPEGLPDDTIQVRLQGIAGQSFGAFSARGLTLRLEGQANDYTGKGLSGARLVVRPPAGAAYPESSIAIGNTSLYGATGGELLVRGVAGERFAVRNSGAAAVVEGVGDHGCEYMTGGTVVVLGPAGRNFAAGMSGGIAFLHDPSGVSRRRVNLDLVDVGPVDDEELLRSLVQRHADETGSPLAAGLLASWETSVQEFVQVTPHDVRRLREETADTTTVDEARA